MDGCEEQQVLTLNDTNTIEHQLLTTPLEQPQPELQDVPTYSHQQQQEDQGHPQSQTRNVTLSLIHI
eukprot:253869-Prorocentrum_lima.AAC.1